MHAVCGPAYLLHASVAMLTRLPSVLANVSPLVTRGALGNVYASHPSASLSEFARRLHLF